MKPIFVSSTPARRLADDDDAIVSCEQRERLRVALRSSCMREMSDATDEEGCV
jgi:hypothetical protein